MKWVNGNCLRVTIAVFLAMAFIVTRVQPGRADTTGQNQTQRTSLIYVTNPPGTGYYAIAVAQGQLLSRKSNINIIVQPSSGPLAIPRLVTKNEAQLGISAATTLYWAYTGTMDFNEPHPFVRLLQSGHDSYYAFITLEKTGIRQISDLKKRRVTCDFPIARLLKELAGAELGAYGLSLSDVSVRRAEFTDRALEDLSRGTTDAVMGTLSGAKMTELASKMKVRVLPFDPGRIASVQKTLPTMYAEKTPEGFPVVGGGVWVVATPAVLWAGKSLPDDTAYTIVKTLNEDYQEIAPIQEDLRGWAPERAVRLFPMPYHPGAVRYYKEKGLWNSQMEANQAKLLKNR